MKINLKQTCSRSCVPESLINKTYETDLPKSIYQCIKIFSNPVSLEIAHYEINCVQVLSQFSSFVATKMLEKRKDINHKNSL